MIVYQVLYDNYRSVGKFGFFYYHLPTKNKNFIGKSVCDKLIIEQLYFHSFKLAQINFRPETSNRHHTNYKPTTIIHEHSCNRVTIRSTMELAHATQVSVSWKRAWAVRVRLCD
jgi:hypothetical protein